MYDQPELSYGILMYSSSAVVKSFSQSICGIFVSDKFQQDPKAMV